MTESAVPSSAAVVVIGGGVIGASIAYHLAAAGVRDVVLLERDALGSGSSAKPLGGVRATFSDPGNILLGQRSLERFESFADTFGADIGLRQVGYLFLARTEAEAVQLTSSTATQQSLGGSSRMVSPAQAAELNPLIDPAAVLAATHSPRDGYAEPARVVHAYAAAAVDRGATVCAHTEVLGVEMRAGAVSAVRTGRGLITADTVVCAAGAWSAAIGAMVGVDLPVVPVRRQIGLTPDPAPAYPTVPFTLDLGSTLYFHNYAGGMLLGISNLDQTAGFDRDFDTSWVPAFDQAAAVVAPGLVGRPLVGGWAGLYENTPDHNAMIGRASQLDGFFYATGFSGHGFLQAPAVGEALADLYRGREPFLDLAPFSADRFATVAERTEVHII